jgi:hypothetical protein
MAQGRTVEALRHIGLASCKVSGSEHVMGRSVTIGCVQLDELSRSDAVSWANVMISHPIYT